mmetsp:Transcript_30833/g.77912  ORF Transcript_30833/g.77912 Transcript_30833/m.77912 type:complete len:108 (+) Transcript_30833:102-425(+)
MAVMSSSLPVLVLRLAAVASSVLAALGQSVRGATETAVAAAEYPMTTVPTNPNSNLAIAALVASAVVVPAMGIGAMLAAKEKGWWGACCLISGLITLLWAYCAYLAL